MELQIKIIGGLFILLAFLHVFFPKYFKWKQELDSLSLINRQMMYIHMFFIAFGVFLLGLLCLISSDALLDTAFGKRISLGLGIFWQRGYLFSSLYIRRNCGKAGHLRRWFIFCSACFGLTLARYFYWGIWHPCNCCADPLNTGQIAKKNLVRKFR
jgi:hypothetical protein